MTPLDELVESACATALARAAAGELLGPPDMMAIFHLSQSAYYRHKARGDFNHLMVRGQAVGTHCYSGVLVHRYLAGEAVYEPTFGRKRGAPVSGALLMAAAMLFAVALVGAVAWLFVRGAEPVDKVSPHWLDTFTRDRRDQ